MLSELHPKSLRTVALLDKKEKWEIDVSVNYIGFTIEGKPWVEGYGLDGGKFGRERPDIIAKNDE